jgi:hypothetical protein
MMTEMTDRLWRAIRKAVEVGLLPESVPQGQYMANVGKIEAVLAAAGLPDLIAERAVVARPQALPPLRYAPCPNGRCRNPINVEGRRWKCDACGWHGDTVDLDLPADACEALIGAAKRLQAAKGGTLDEAIMRLIDAGIEEEAPICQECGKPFGPGIVHQHG